MVNFISKYPPTLERFLVKFRDNFSKPLFISFSIYVGGLFLELKRTNIQTIAQSSTASSYERLQYFLSEGEWDQEELNNDRLQLLQGNRTTKTCRKGIMALDDTSCKKWAKKTQGLQDSILCH